MNRRKINELTEAVFRRLLGEELRVKTAVKPSRISGIGLFAAQDIPRGTIVFSWNDLVDQEYSTTYPESLPPGKKDEFIELASTDGDAWFLAGDGAAYFNHSEDPNTSVEPGDLPSAKRNTRSNKDIVAGEELTMNYAEVGLDGPEDYMD